jgi:hypothetical protein
VSLRCAFAAGSNADELLAPITSRGQILGSTPHPEALFMQQIVRTLTMADGGAVDAPHVLICDRDRKWNVMCGVDSKTRGSVSPHPRSP